LLDGVTGTLVTEAGTQTLSNKTLTDPKIPGYIADSNGNELIKFTTTAGAVNEITITNAATGGDPTIAATGSDTNIDLQLSPKGGGNVLLGNFNFDVDQTVGLSQDNYVLTYDDGTGYISLEAAPGLVNDTNPALSGNLNTTGFKIVTSSNANIDLEPNGTGNVLLGNYTFDVDQTVGFGQDNYVLTYDHSAGHISLEAAAGGGISNVVEDTTPQLGGNLDVNSNKIVSTTNGDIDIEPNGTGNVLLGNLTFDADQTVGSGQDDYILTYDNSAGTIGLEALDASAWYKNDSFPQIGTGAQASGYQYLKIFDHTFGTNETAHFKIELVLNVVSGGISNSPNYCELFVDLYRTSSGPVFNFSFFPYDYESTLIYNTNVRYSYDTSGRFQIWIYRSYSNLLASGRLTNLTPTITGGTYDNVHVDLDRSNAWETSFSTLPYWGSPEYRDMYAEDYYGENVYATYLKPASSLQLTSSSKYILMGDSAQIRLGGSSDAKIWYSGSANSLDIELESAAQSVNITDNGTDRFIFYKSTGNLTVTGDIAVNGGDITSTTGQIALGNYAFDVDQTVSASEDDYVLTYDNTSGQIRLEANAGGGGGSGSSFPNSTFTTCPGSEGNFDLSYNVAQTSQETPFEASGTDAFGVNLGSVFSLMDPVGSTDGPFDMGVLT